MYVAIVSPESSNLWIVSVKGKDDSNIIRFEYGNSKVAFEVAEALNALVRRLKEDKILPF
jgi:regulator of extracellular matrix RemA (YlzA/DUF370 family)